ncbi:hypothetical protein BJ508DRAFT_300945 [Ascobolus immersus RN42]|uniref:Uncharacterized protein n=1 Tax=Ascobolus immersus RN42 TaxID=1160509 RepID=A0A3N4IPP8_ASCIM|nr:hypothetical protein BJ508DRAFT_300945 [Ascobolus immersus RN42]
MITILQTSKQSAAQPSPPVISSPKKANKQQLLISRLLIKPMLPCKCIRAVRIGRFGTKKTAIPGRNLPTTQNLKEDGSLRLWDSATSLMAAESPQDQWNSYPYRSSVSKVAVVFDLCRASHFSEKLDRYPGCYARSRRQTLASIDEADSCWNSTKQPPSGRIARYYFSNNDMVRAQKDFAI